MASTYGENSMVSPSRIEESDRKGSDLEKNAISTSEDAINGEERDTGFKIIPEAQSLVTKSLLKPITSEDEADCFEIFDVRVFYNGRKTCGKIHGSIYYEGAIGFRELYKRNKNNAEIVSFPGNLTLTGLPYAITGYDPLLMHLNIWHGIEEVSRGVTTEWTPYGWCIQDKVITEEIKGRNGSAVISYAIMTNVVIASVEVSLVKGNRKSLARIYGTITASMTGWDVKRVLFCKKRDKYINVDSGAPIPLLRSVLIIPRTSSLHIDADLSDAFSFPNVPIASGSVQFSPEFYGDFAGTISGKYGEIKVNVKWWSYFNHPETYKTIKRYFY